MRIPKQRIVDNFVPPTAEETDLLFLARSYVVIVGMTEDGDCVHGFDWCIMAERESTGERWAHYYTVRTERDVRPEVVSTLLARMSAGTPALTDPALWSPTHGRYGSAAYEAYDNAEQIAFEKAAG